MNDGSTPSNVLINGMLAFEAGKAIIQSWSSPFSYGGRNYFWDNYPHVRSDDIVCSITLDELQKLSDPSKQGRRKRQTNSNTTTSPSSTTMAPNEVLRNAGDKTFAEVILEVVSFFLADAASGRTEDDIPKEQYQ
ncbi:hypothetical protein KIN20_007387 [Parelaphostrongylus tenuis]|uniref:Uncharacterized protein n=1 Tax=Parelaphostrongylus tenuis TaxID=148309 RepID=A0AAD5M3C1_PARTN|nr:hypothetical protein KIN20_007387 [Parelaphostrongylus tenuis]